MMNLESKVYVSRGSITRNFYQLNCFICEFFLKLCPVISDTVVLNFSIFLIAQDNTMDTDSQTDHFIKSVIEMSVI